MKADKFKAIVRKHKGEVRAYVIGRDDGKYIRVYKQDLLNQIADGDWECGYRAEFDAERGVLWIDADHDASEDEE